MSSEINRRTVTIRGVLTLTANTHQTSTEKKEGNTLQAKTNVVAYENGTPRLMFGVPYVSANSVRGMIRRACGDVLMEQISDMHGQIGRNLYLSIMRGGFARTGINAGGATYTQLVTAQDHMFVGLFGGGAFMYPAKARIDRDLFPMLKCIDTIFPMVDQLKCLDARPDQIISKTLIASKDDFARMPKLDVIEDHEAAYLEHMTKKMDQQKASIEQKNQARSDGVFVNADDKVKKDDLNTFTEVEVIIPGTPMFFSFTLDDVTDAQIGLFLCGLQSWANRNALGGGSARGRGSFIASLRLEEGNEILAENVLLDGAPSFNLSDKVDGFVQAMRADLEHAALPSTLGAIYPTELIEKPVKVKKTPKTAAKKDDATSETSVDTFADGNQVAVVKEEAAA